MSCCSGVSLGTWRRRICGLMQGANDPAGQRRARCIQSKLVTEGRSWNYSGHSARAVLTYGRVMYGVAGGESSGT